MKNEVIEIPNTKLTGAEENYLASKGTSGAKSKLILHNINEAKAYAYKCAKGAVPQDELLSLCYDALSKAAKNFKPNRVRFFAYAKVYVRREISAWWVQQDVVKYASLHETPIGETDHRPALDEDAEDYSREAEPTSFEFDAVHFRELMGLILPIIKTKLTKMEQMAIDLYYNGSMGFDEIGEILGRTRQRAQSIHQEGLKKIRHELINRKQYFRIFSAGI